MTDELVLEKAMKNDRKEHPGRDAEQNQTGPGMAEATPRRVGQQEVEQVRTHGAGNQSGQREPIGPKSLEREDYRRM